MRGRGFRLILTAAVLTSGGLGAGYGYLTGGTTDRKVNEELAFGYEVHLKTVRELVGHARAHAIEPQFGFGQAVERATARPNVTNRASFAQFESEQGVIANAARELIATMDAELEPGDNTFTKLIHRFDSEERTLSRIRSRQRHARLKIDSEP